MVSEVPIRARPAAKQRVKGLPLGPKVAVQNDLVIVLLPGSWKKYVWNEYHDMTIYHIIWLNQNQI